MIFLLVLAFVLELAGAPHRSSAVHAAFLKATGYPQGRPGFVVDHITPLCAGGPDMTINMQWQPAAEALKKDDAERALCSAIRKHPASKIDLVATFEVKWRAAR